MTADAAPAKPGPRGLITAAGRKLLQFVPSRRSLAVGAGIAALGACAYAIARETSIFAVQSVTVVGGSGAVDAEVRHALAPFIGTSLVGLDGASVLQRVEALPTVISARYDRSFPNTLSVTIVPEQPIAVFRNGRAAWLVSARGRVMQSVTAHADRTLPRIWEGGKPVHLGDILPPTRGGAVARALDYMRAFGPRVATAGVTNGALVLHLRSGLQVIFGGPTDIPLKAAITAKILHVLQPGTKVVDVSVPSRPVTSTQ